MAISALEQACFERKKNIQFLSDAQKKSMMNYTGKNFFKPSGIELEKPHNFDKYDDGFNYAILQLDVIEQYLDDFNKISGEWARKKKLDEKYAKGAEA